MIGLSIDSFELWESLNEKELHSNILLAADAEILQNSSSAKKLQKLRPASLSVRNAAAPRLNRLILESNSKLQNDYLASLSRSMQHFQQLGAEKIMLDFDLPSVFFEENLQTALKHILGCIKGIAYEFDIKTELLFRVPLPEIELFTKQAAFFRQKSMLGMNYAVDIHVHEAGFDREDFCNALLPVQYDIGTVNFIYDAALGNKINPLNLKKTVDFVTAKGAECDFVLCPSGNVNFQTVSKDAEQWFAVFE